MLSYSESSNYNLVSRSSDSAVLCAFSAQLCGLICGKSDNTQPYRDFASTPIKEDSLRRVTPLLFRGDIRGTNEIREYI
jgi:hypothetical protein